MKAKVCPDERISLSLRTVWTADFSLIVFPKTRGSDGSNRWVGKSFLAITDRFYWSPGAVVRQEEATDRWERQGGVRIGELGEGGWDGE